MQGFLTITRFIAAAFWSAWSPAVRSGRASRCTLRRRLALELRRRVTDSAADRQHAVANRLADVVDRVADVADGVARQGHAVRDAVADAVGRGAHAVSGAAHDVERFAKASKTE